MTAELLIKLVLERTKDPAYCTGAVRDIELLIVELMRREAVLEKTKSLITDLKATINFHEKM